MKLRRGHTKKHSQKSRKHGGGKFVGGKRTKRSHSYKRRYLGGDNALNQAYTGSPLVTQSNPNMAFLESNPNANANAYPPTDPAPIVPSYMNSQAMSRGGRRGRKQGTRRIRIRGGGCGCGLYGGSGGNVIPAVVPALAGTPVNGGDISTWPGVDGVSSGASSYPNYAINTYAPNDVSREMVATGAQPPFSTGGRRRSAKRGGGFLSTFVPEYGLNIGRGIVHSGSNVANSLLGNLHGTDPAPWIQSNMQNSAYKAVYNPII